MIKTEDPTVMIEDIGPAWVIYRDHDGKRWIMRGTCNQCGECEVGAINPNIMWIGNPVGEPGSCRDVMYGIRRDIPVRPEIKQKFPNCSLSGEYLDGDKILP